MTNKTLIEITKELNESEKKVNESEKKVNESEKKVNEKKVQLIYAFNGVGKTRLSREFKELIAPKDEHSEELNGDIVKILYYNALTEDLFYWDNDLGNDIESTLKIQPNKFTSWILKQQGQDSNIIENFQRYTNSKINPEFNNDFNEVSFSIGTEDDKQDNIKISKGEESNFIWSIFYSLMEQIIEELNITEIEERSTQDFNNLEYIFIDDPVSSLDENHLIQLAVDISTLIKRSESDLKFIITTHNPLFYNVLYNQFKNNKKKNKYTKYLLEKKGDDLYNLRKQNSDSPFPYHLLLLSELNEAIKNNDIKKYHFNFLRNILEKTATFLGYEQWSELLPKSIDNVNQSSDKVNLYYTRIINISSHSKHSGEETAIITPQDVDTLKLLVNDLQEKYDNFKDTKND